MNKLIYKKVIRCLHVGFAILIIVGLVAHWNIGGYQSPASAEAAAGDMILLWDDVASIPSGWTCVSCVAGDPFFGVFPRGAAAYSGTTAGQDSVSHVASAPASSIESVTIGTTDAGVGTDYAGPGHTHTMPGTVTSNSGIRPPFKNLRFISKNNPATLPAGAIGIFDVSSGSLPSGWTYYSAIEGLYLRGENVTTTGGAATHTHPFVILAANFASNKARGSGGSQVGVGGGVSGHSHTVSGTTGSANNDPPFITAVFGKLSADAAAPSGLIAMFNAAPPSGWTSVSGAGQDFNNRFVKGATTYGAVGGSATHTHADSVVVSSGPDTTNTTRSGATIQSPTSAHTHTFTVSFASASSLPLYRDVIFAKKDTTNQAPNTPSQNTPVNGATNVSTSTVFTMTSTDPDSDALQYKVTIYSNSGCSTVVQTNDQSVSQTGWSGQNATVSLSNDAYQSGTQATFTVQSMLAESTTYWWRAAAKDPLGTNTFVSSATCNNFTTAAAPSPPPPLSNTNISSNVAEHWAWNDAIKWIDFYNTDTIVVSASGLTGYASSSIGDISLDCATTGGAASNICAQSNYQVLNDGNGNLSGWGWNDVVGWISFCGGLNVANCPGSLAYRTLIDNNTGDFSGWAWNDIAGWVSFNCIDLGGGCASSNYKVKTNWTSASTNGHLDSSTFDTGVSGGAAIQSIVWQGSQPAGTAVQFQIATSNSSAGPWNFIGSDGTGSSYYPPSAAASAPNQTVAVQYAIHNNNRYFRYRVILFSNQAQTASPRIDRITVHWSP